MHLSFTEKMGNSEMFVYISHTDIFISAMGTVKSLTVCYKAISSVVIHATKSCAAVLLAEHCQSKLAKIEHIKHKRAEHFTHKFAVERCQLFKLFPSLLVDRSCQTAQSETLIRN